MVKYLRIREFRNYFHIPVILSADPIQDQEFGPLGTHKGFNRRPEEEETQPQGHGGGALKEGETAIGLGQGQTTPIPVPAYASAENSELAQKMSYLEDASSQNWSSRPQSWSGKPPCRRARVDGQVNGGTPRGPGPCEATPDQWQRCPC